MPRSGLSDLRRRLSERPAGLLLSLHPGGCLFPRGLSVPVLPWPRASLLCCFLSTSCAHQTSCQGQGNSWPQPPGLCFTLRGTGWGRGEKAGTRALHLTSGAPPVSSPSPPESGSLFLFYLCTLGEGRMGNKKKAFVLLSSRPILVLGTGVGQLVGGRRPGVGAIEGASSMTAVSGMHPFAPFTKRNPFLPHPVRPCHLLGMSVSRPVTSASSHALSLSFPHACDLTLALCCLSLPSHESWGGH